MKIKTIVVGLSILILIPQANAWFSFFNKDKSSGSTPVVKDQVTIGNNKLVENPLETRKKDLNTKIMTQVNKCRCYIGLINNKQQYYSTLKEQGTYHDYISDLKINAGREQTKLLSAVKNWPLTKNTPADLSNLDIKISEGLRAMSSFCYQPFSIIADQINTAAKSRIVDTQAKACQ